MHETAQPNMNEDTAFVFYFSFQEIDRLQTIMQSY